MLAAELLKLERDCEIHITHLKPGQSELTMGEIETCIGDFKPACCRTTRFWSSDMQMVPISAERLRGFEPLAALRRTAA